MIIAGPVCNVTGTRMAARSGGGLPCGATGRGWFAGPGHACDLAVIAVRLESRPCKSTKKHWPESRAPVRRGTAADAAASKSSTSTKPTCAMPTPRVRTPRRCIVSVARAVAFTSASSRRESPVMSVTCYTVWTAITCNLTGRPLKNCHSHPIGQA